MKKQTCKYMCAVSAGFAAFLAVHGGHAVGVSMAAYFAVVSGLTFLEWK